MNRGARSGREGTGARYRVALPGGAACGDLWVLVVATVVTAARPGMITGPLIAGIRVATGLPMAVLLARSAPLREIWGRAAIAPGLMPFLAAIVALLLLVVRPGDRPLLSAPARLRAVGT